MNKTQHTAAHNNSMQISYTQLLLWEKKTGHMTQIQQSTNFTHTLVSDVTVRV